MYLVCGFPIYSKLCLNLRIKIIISSLNILAEMNNSDSNTANFVQKTFDILQVSPITFRIHNIITSLHGSHRVNNLPSDRQKCFKMLYCPNSSDIEMSIVSFDRYVVV